VNKKLTKEWVDAQIEKQHCVDWGENDYSLRYEHEYHSDGIYYSHHIWGERREFIKEVVCRLPWSSDLDDFLIPIVKDEDTAASFDQYRFHGGFILFAQDGKIMGFSTGMGVPQGYNSIIEGIMDIFKVKYDIKKIRVNDRDALLAIKKDHVIREISGDKFNTLQFFEADFFDAKVTEIK
jgi:hypothetical protein